MKPSSLRSLSRRDSLVVRSGPYTKTKKVPLFEVWFAPIILSTIAGSTLFGISFDSEYTRTPKTLADWLARNI